MKAVSPHQFLEPNFRCAGQQVFTQAKEMPNKHRYNNLLFDDIVGELRITQKNEFMLKQEGIEKKGV